MMGKAWFSKAVALLTVLAVLVCCALMAAARVAGPFDTGITMAYESKLFDTTAPLSLDITIGEDDWADLLENALEETYYRCQVTVNGTVFRNVAIRAKGNTSLSRIANDPDSDRYSFKLEFDHYDESQTCFGLDKLVLNNNYADATNMKEALVYDMFAFLGADASLYNYASVSVNGVYRGVYLALEAVEDSFLMRCYGAHSGALYKPENEGLGGGKADNALPGNAANPPAGGDNPPTPADRLNNNAETTDRQSRSPSADDNTTRPTLPGDAADGNGFGEKRPGDHSGLNRRDTRSSGGADLNYQDNNTDSYSALWDGAVTAVNQQQKARVVRALKNISTRTDLSTYLDTDNLLRYLAVHTFSVNLDSLSGSMAHNYYLYEQNGALNLIPWDYNLAWGGFSQGGSSATDTVNFAIDTPFSSDISTEDRSFFMALLENETYRKQYHTYLRQLCEEYINGGRFQTVYTRIRSQIDTLVATDPTAFYTYEEYDTAAQMLCRVLALRAESVLGQLDGSIPSYNEAQQANPDALVDASDLDLSVMGTMGGEDGGRKNARAVADTAAETDTGTGTASAGSNAAVFPSETTDHTETAVDPASADTDTVPNSRSTDNTNSETNTMFPDNTTDRNKAGPGGPDGNRASGTPGGESTGTVAYSPAALITAGACLAAILAALGVASLVRRGPRHHA